VNNLKQIGIATAMYLGADAKAAFKINGNDRLWHWEAGKTYWDGLGVLIKGRYAPQPEMFYCPAQEATNWKFLTYRNLFPTMLNKDGQRVSGFDNISAGYILPRQATDWREPQVTASLFGSNANQSGIYIGKCKPGWVLITDTALYFLSRTGENNGGAIVNDAATRTRMQHRKSANALYADGHCETWSLDRALNAKWHSSFPYYECYYLRTFNRVDNSVNY
jgi:prepilin-type processing-associated H-X9-DG protein